MTNINPVASSSPSNLMDSSSSSKAYYNTHYSQNPVENNSPLPTSWRKGSKYYNIHIQPNLFGEICVIKSWGGIGSKRAGFKVIACENTLEASKVIQEIAKRRKSRGYRVALPSTATPYPTQELLREVGLSRFEQFKQLIIPGASVDDQDDQGFTALKWAAYYGQAKIALLLIEAGANVDSLDYHGSTALMEAVWKKRTEIVKLLIKYGANVNVMNRKSSTALSLAALGEREEIVTMLVKAGAARAGGASRTTRVTRVFEVGTAEPSTEAAAMKGSKKQGVLNYTECIEHGG